MCQHATAQAAKEGKSSLKKSVYELTVLALKPTSWSRNMHCVQFPASLSLVTGTRFIAFQLQPGSDKGCAPYDLEKQLPLLPQLPLVSHQDTRTKLTLSVDSSAKDICTYPHPQWPALGTNFLLSFDRNSVTPQSKFMLSKTTWACKHFIWDKL